MLWCSNNWTQHSNALITTAIWGHKLEFLIAFLVFLIATCFLVELGYSKPDALEVVRGLFVPDLKGNEAAGLAISLLGAMVMPHNLFLHSALVLSRKVPQSVNGIKEACRFDTIESAFTLTVAFLINISIKSVSDAVCGSGNLNPEDQANCSDLDLKKASFLLKNVLGNWSSKLFALPCWPLIRVLQLLGHMLDNMSCRGLRINCGFGCIKSSPHGEATSLLRAVGVCVTSLFDSPPSAAAASILIDCSHNPAVVAASSVAASAARGPIASNGKQHEQATG